MAVNRYKSRSNFADKYTEFIHIQENSESTPFTNNQILTPFSPTPEIPFEGVENVQNYSGVLCLNWMLSSGSDKRSVSLPSHKTLVYYWKLCPFLPPHHSLISWKPILNCSLHHSWFSYNVIKPEFLLERNCSNLFLLRTMTSISTEKTDN